MGAGATLDAQSLSRLLDVRSDARLTLTNITLINGLSSTLGGAAFVAEGAALSLHNSSIAECTAQVGGAIFSTAGNVSLYGSSIVGSHSYSYGGALALFRATVILVGSIISTSTAQAEGGTLYMEGGQCNVVGSYIAGSTAVSGSGGALYITASGLLHLAASAIVKSSAFWAGGGLRLERLSVAT